MTKPEAASLTGDARLDRFALIASLATSEQAQLAAAFRLAGSPPFKGRTVNYSSIEPDFVGTEVEQKALFNGLRQHAPEVNEDTPLEELRKIKTRLLR